MNSLFHIYCRGKRVIFRKDSDYIFFINRFAVLSEKFRMNPLALTVMSTHYHSIIEPSNPAMVEEFLSLLKRMYSMYYSKHYEGAPRDYAMEMNSIEIEGFEMAKKELIYVLKNPVHHYVKTFPISYQYGSASTLFLSELAPTFNIKAYESINNINQRTLRAIAGREAVPDKFMVTPDGMVTFDSFVNQPRARSFWNGNVKKFLYDMNSITTDKSGEMIQYDALDLATSGLSDTEVCSIIDSAASSRGLKSFHQLDGVAIANLAKALKNKGIPLPQIDRCLWL